MAKFYEKQTYSDCTVIACPASYKQKSSASFDFGHVFFDSAQNNLVFFKVDTPSHCVYHRFGLLEDFLLHEWTVAAWKSRISFVQHCISSITSLQHSWQNKSYISKFSDRNSWLQQANRYKSQQIFMFLLKFICSVWTLVTAKTFSVFI